MTSVKDNIKKRVYEINLHLSRSDLVIQNFGNASSRMKDGFAIKPSGINLETSNYKEMIYMDLGGNKIEGNLKPSSDEPTHRQLYLSEESVNGVVHTHSKFATAFAQANVDIQNLGTTHSDFSKYQIFVTDQLTEAEVNSDYELNTGKKIIKRLEKENIKMLEVPGVLSIRHGVFAWGNSVEEAYKNAEIIEYIAELFFLTKIINPNAEVIESYIANKHFNRKHGPDKYYGQ